MNAGLSQNCHILVFCSARELTASAAVLGAQALDVVEGLTVRMQRVHVEMLESFRSAVLSEVASSFASLQVAERGTLGEQLPANTTGYLDNSPSLEALNESRSALGVFPPVVVDDRPDNDVQAGGKSGSADDARILEAWYDESMTLGIGLGSMLLAVRSRALLMTTHFASLTTVRFQRSSWRSSC